MTTDRTRIDPGDVLTPDLKAFIDGAVIPALVKDWLACNGDQDPLAPASSDVENATGLVPERMLSAEQGVAL